MADELSKELQRKNREIQSLNAQKEIFVKWIELTQKGGTILSYLDRKEIKTVVVYGINHFTVLFCREMEMAGIEVLCGISQRKPLLELNIPLYDKEKLAEYAERIDAVIVTAVYYYDEIYDEIKGMLPERVKILSMADLVYDGLITLEDEKHPIII